MAVFKTGTGFSIELIGWKLEYRGIYKELPQYESLGGKVTAIALVKNPAIGIGSVGETEAKTITGPIMIPDLRIFRNIGLNGPENCYWYFSAKTINELQKSFKGEIKIGH